MATTTNYGWTTPDDTALVKDGASAIRTLGSSVDTTTKNLNPSTTLGDIEYRSSTANTNTRLGIGSTGQVLTVSGGVPSWQPAGAMTLLSTTSLSGATTVISGISGSYKDLMIYIYGVTNATADGDFRVAPNGTTNITYQIGIYGDAGASVTPYVEGTATYLFLTYSPGVIGRSFGTNSFVLRIPDYANTSYEKSFYHEGQYQLGGSAPAFLHSTGRIGTTSAISSLTFSNSGGNLSTGTVQVYGVK
jgi:hypothetical protein